MKIRNSIVMKLKNLISDEIKKKKTKIVMKLKKSNYEEIQKLKL